MSSNYSDRLLLRNFVEKNFGDKIKNAHPSPNSTGQTTAGHTVSNKTAPPVTPSTLSTTIAKMPILQQAPSTSHSIAPALPAAHTTLLPPTPPTPKPKIIPMSHPIPKPTSILSSFPAPIPIQTPATAVALDSQNIEDDQATVNNVIFHDEIASPLPQALTDPIIVENVEAKAAAIPPKINPEEEEIDVAVDELKLNYFPFCNKAEKEAMLLQIDHIRKIKDKNSVYLPANHKFNTENPLNYLAFHQALVVLDSAAEDREFNPGDPNRDTNKEAVLIRAKAFVIKNYVLPRRYWCDYLESLCTKIEKDPKYFSFRCRSDTEQTLMKDVTKEFVRLSSWGPGVCVHSYVTYRRVKEDIKENIDWKLFDSKLDSIEHELTFVPADNNVKELIVLENRSKYRRRGEGQKADKVRLAGKIPTKPGALSSAQQERHSSASYIFFIPNSPEFNKVKNYYDAIPENNPFHRKPPSLPPTDKGDNKNVENFKLLDFEFRSPLSTDLEKMSEEVSNKWLKYKIYFALIMEAANRPVRSVVKRCGNIVEQLSLLMNSLDLKADWPLYLKLVQFESDLNEMLNAEEFNEDKIKKHLQKANSLCCLPLEKWEEVGISPNDPRLELALRLSDCGMFSQAGKTVTKDFVEGLIDITRKEVDGRLVPLIKNLEKRNEEIVAYLASILSPQFPTEVRNMIIGYTGEFRSVFRVNSLGGFVYNCLYLSNSELGCTDYLFEMNGSMVSPVEFMKYGARQEKAKERRRRRGQTNEEKAKAQDAIQYRTDMLMIKALVSNKAPELFSQFQ